MRTLLLQVALCTALAAAASTASAAEPLASPYRAAPAMPGPAEPLGTCPPPPPVVRDVNIESVFAGKNFKQAVPERIAARRAATEPLQRFLRKAVELSERSMLLAGEARKTTADCLDIWLESWLAHGAMLGEVSWPEGEYERKWILIALGLGYLEAHAGEETVVAPDWLREWFAAATDNLQERYALTARTRNNHFYWAGLASVVAGTIMNDTKRYDWGIEQYRLGLSAIDSTGFLPLELKRGGGAIAYHATSASALVTIAAFEAANGRPLAEKDAKRLQRLVRRIFSGLEDPAEFEKRAGAPQNPLDAGAVRALAWIEIYYALTGDAEAEPWLRRFRPMQLVWLGGNLTAAFGKPVPPGELAQSPLIQP